MLFFDKFVHNGNTYWYDAKDAVLNMDAQIVGYFINQPDGSKMIYMFRHDNDDNRTYDEVIEEIENQ